MSLISVHDKIVSACLNIIPPNASVVVAVSGGCDSVALLFLLHHLRKRLGIAKLVVAHVNYGMRGAESDADEALVHSFGDVLDLPVFVKKMEGHLLTEPGMEEWARHERYRFFDRVRTENDCTLVATGHTLEDQAETIIMRLLRGSGLNGLQGIAARREDGVIRPLLALRKAELVAFLDEVGVTYRYDASNGDVRLLRNKIRHELMPLLETYHTGATAHFAAVASEVQTMFSVQREQIANWIRRNCFSTGRESIRVNRQVLSAGSIAGEGLRQLLVESGITPDRYHIDHMIDASPQRDRKVLLPGGWYGTAGKRYLYIERSISPMHLSVAFGTELSLLNGFYRLVVSREAEMPTQLDAGLSTVYFDGDLAGESLFVRSVTPDDHFIPFGRKHSVSVHHFLAGLGIPDADREHALILVTEDNKPIWLFGIRLDNRFRVTSATKRVIKAHSSSIF